MTVVRVGTRSSALALWQAHHVVARLRELAPDARIEIVEISSAGDEVTDAQEIRFLTERLEQLRAAENSTPSSRN